MTPPQPLVLKATVHELPGLPRKIVVYVAGSCAPVLLVRIINAVALGRAFIANTDLVECLRHGKVLNEDVRRTYYGGAARGYNKCPLLGRH